MSDIYLYLLIRDDLPSLNPGKAVAHGAHAANQCVFEMKNKYKPNSERGEMLSKWESATPSGFGTTIALAANIDQIKHAINIAQALGYDADLTVDPSYPFIVDEEMASLIPHSDNPELKPTPLGNGKILCLREETTAAYVFGYKEDIKPILVNFPLMP